jgi:O-antigen/teichoic acid export membrane protein
VRSPIAGGPSRIGPAGGALLLASLVGNGLNYLFLIGLARVLPSAEFGTYALGLAIFNLVALISVVGLDTGAVKFVSHHLGLANHGEARRVIFRVLWAGGLCGGVAGLGLAFLSGPLATVIYANPALAPVLRWFALAVPLLVSSTVLLAALQAFQSVRYTVTIKYLWEPLGRIVLVALLLRAGFGLTGVAAACAGILAVSLTWSLRAVWARAGFAAGGSAGPGGPGLRALAVYCLPLGAANLIGIVATRADLLLLGYWRESQDVGMYLTAFQTAAVISLVLGAFDAVLGPVLSRAWARGDRRALEEAYQEGTRLGVTVTVPLALLLVLFAPHILGLFGPAFRGGAGCLVVLVLGQWFNSVAAFGNNVLLMAGAPRVVMGQTAASGVLLIAGAAFLIPRWGMEGAAVAATVAVIAVNLARVWEVRRRVGIRPWTRGLLSPLGAGAATAVVVKGLETVFAGTAWPVLAALCLILYAGFLILFGVHHDDRDLMLSLLRSLKMGSGSTVLGGACPQAGKGTVPAGAGPQYRER